MKASRRGLGLWAALASLGLATGSFAADPIHVGAIEVTGDTGAVTRADLKSAIQSFASGHDGKGPSALVVIGKDEIHGYLANRELGWLTIRHRKFVEPDGTTGTQWSTEGQGLPQFAAAMDCIRGAEAISVFPIDPKHPHFDNQHLRVLSAPARASLVALLGRESTWYQGLYTLFVEYEPRDLGFVFKCKAGELVLFLNGMFADGTLNGERFSGVLELDDRSTAGRDLEKWKREHAQAELGAQLPERGP